MDLNHRRPMANLFNEGEIERIREQALNVGLDAIVCPRDGTRLGFQPQIFQAVRTDKHGRGVKMGDVRDVHSIAAECAKCGSRAEYVSLLRE